MKELLDTLPIPTWLLTAMGVSSLLFIIFSGLFMPPLISRIPADYFIHARRSLRERHHPLFVLLFIVIRNAIGILLIAAGIIMLFTPGQGVLTILAGFMAAIFPGKRKLECWIATRKPVWRGLNWLRKKHGTQPLMHPEERSTPTPQSKNTTQQP
jgi:hypothetical protein